MVDEQRQVHTSSSVPTASVGATDFVLHGTVLKIASSSTRSVCTPTFRQNRQSWVQPKHQSTAAELELHAQDLHRLLLLPLLLCWRKRAVIYSIKRSLWWMRVIQLTRPWVLEGTWPGSLGEHSRNVDILGKASTYAVSEAAPTSRGFAKKTHAKQVYLP